MSNKSEKERQESVARASAAYYDMLKRKTRLELEDIKKLFADGWVFQENYDAPDTWVSAEGRLTTVHEMITKITREKKEAEVADNLKGIPFTTSDEGFSYPSLAKEIVCDQARALMPPSVRDGFTKDDVYVVWFAYVLGYWKALCSTNIADGRYYEVTFNRDKGVAYVDTYRKTHNIEVNINQKEVNS